MEPARSATPHGEGGGPTAARGGTADSRPGPSRDLALWGILALGLLLRLWKLDGDLPYVLHYDEPTMVDNAVWMWRHGTLNPHFFNYPTGLIYLLAAFYGLVMLGGVIAGRFDGFAQALQWIGSGTYPRPPEGGVLYFYPTLGVPALYLIGRSISVAAGVIAIAAIHAVARRIGGSPRAARMAAFFLAVSPLAVEHSHLITTDMASAGLATLALLGAIRAEAGGRKEWILAGILAGLAAGTKYNAGLVALVLAALAVWRWRSERMNATRLLLYGALAAALAFIVTTPYAVLDFSRFAKDLAYEFHRVSSITPTFRGAEAVEATPAEKIGGIVWHNLGAAGMIAALAGAAAAIRTRRFGPSAVVVWVAATFLPMFMWESLYARYILLPWPAVLLLAAWGVEAVLGSISRWRKLTPDAERKVLALLLILVLLPGTIRLVRRESRRATLDPRIEMTAWIDENVPAGERVVIEPGGAFPRTDRLTVDRIDFLGRELPATYLSRGIRFLGASGRERLVRGEEACRGVFRNLDAIKDSSDIVWSRDRYAIYYLRGRLEWEDSLSAALDRGDLAGGREMLEARTEAFSPTPYLWKTLSFLRLQLGDTAAAAQGYRIVAAMDTTDVETPLILSDLALGERDWDEALRHLAVARRISPRAHLIHHNLAVAYLYRAQDRLRAGGRDSARVDWNRARESAAYCAKVAPADPEMLAIRDQVDRMGRRWGFEEGRRP